MEPSFHNQPTARQTEAYLRCSGLKNVFSLGTCEKISYAGIAVCREKDFGGQLPAELKKIIPSHLATQLYASMAICAWTTGDSRHSTATTFLFFLEFSQENTSLMEDQIQDFHNIPWIKWETRIKQVYLTLGSG